MDAQKKLLEEDPMPKALLKLSLPATVGMLFNSLYNIVDTIFVGDAVGALAIGGLTVAFPIQIAIMAIAIMIGVGTQSNISILFGAGEREKAAHYAGNGYTLGFLIALVLSILGSIWLIPVLRVFGASDVLIPYAQDYAKILIIGLIPWVLCMIFNAIKRGEGNAKIPMIVNITGLGLNIILDPIFIYSLDMGIQGAAWATVLSEYVAFAVAGYFFFTHNSVIPLHKRDFLLKAPIAKKIFAFGFPSFMSNIASSISSTCINNATILYGGALTLSAAGIINRVFMFIFLPSFGVVQGVQPIIGFNYGAKNKKRILEAIKLCLFIVTLYSITVYLILSIWGAPIVGIFTKDTKAIAIGVHALKLVLISVPIVGVPIIASIYFTSIGKPKLALFQSLLRQIGLLVPFVFLLPRIGGLGMNGVWISFPSSDIIAAIVATILLTRSLKGLDEEFAKSPRSQSDENLSEVDSKNAKADLGEIASENTTAGDPIDE